MKQLKIKTTMANLTFVRLRSGFDSDKNSPFITVLCYCKGKVPKALNFWGFDAFCINQVLKDAVYISYIMRHENGCNGQFLTAS